MCNVFKRVRISFVMFVCKHGTTRLTLDEMSRNLKFENFSQNLSSKFKFKFDKNNGYFT